MEIKTRWAQDKNGKVIPFATVSLFYEGTTDPVTGLEDKDGSPLSNPFQSDVNGKVVFAAPDGQYDIKFSSGPRESTASIQFLDVSGALQVVENIDALRSIAGNSGRDYILAKFHTSDGDGGGGNFYWQSGEAPGTYVDNGGTIIVPAGGDGSAAWLREFSGPILAPWFGFQDADSSDAAQRLIDAANGGDVTWPSINYPYQFGEVTVSAPQTWRGEGDLSITDEITVASTGFKIRQMPNINFSGGDLFLIPQNTDTFEIVESGIRRTAGTGRAVNIQGSAVYNLRVYRSDFICENPVSGGGEAIDFGVNTNNDAGFNVEQNTFDGWQSGFRSGASGAFFRKGSTFKGNIVINCTGYGAFFYHTRNVTIDDNQFMDNQIGVFIDAAESIEGNTFSGTKNYPSVLPPSDGAVADLTDPDQAAAWRIYNGHVDGFKGAVMVYNGADVFNNNIVRDNAWDGLIISVDNFKDTDGIIENNTILNNGRHGVFISPQPRGDSWGGDKRIYSPVIQGGVIAGNAGHAVCVDGRYVADDLTITYHRIDGPVLMKGVSTRANGATGWYDEMGVLPSIMRVYCADNVIRCGLHQVEYYNILQGSSNATYNGLWVIDNDPASSAANNNDVWVKDCTLHQLESTGKAVRCTKTFGRRWITNSSVRSLADSIAFNATVNGGSLLNRGNWDDAGNTN